MLSPYETHMMSTSIAVIPEKLLQTIAESGPFAAGSVFGGLLASGFHWLASRERVERAKLDQQRESELLKQNSLKDKRIDALHERLDGNHKVTKTAAPKKGGKAE
jgi:hypothetical protein